jgi:hypothetical protein
MTIGAPLGVNITADSRQAETALQRVERRVEAVTSKTKQAVLVQRDWNREMSQNLRTGAQAATVVGAGRAGAGVGAAAGGVAAGGTLGTLAAIAGAASVVLSVTQRFTALAEESARRRLDFENQLANAAEKAKDARSTSADRGMSQEQAYRKAMAAGGPAAIRRADALIEAGVDPTEAYAAAADSQAAAGRYGHDNVNDLLAKIARRGGNVGEAAKTLARRPWMADSPTAVTDLTGQDVDGWTDYNLSTDPFLRRAEENRRLRGQRALADRDNAAAGANLGSARRDVAMATNPEGVLRGDAIAGIDRVVTQLDRLASQQSKVASVIADIFQPGGSFETQMGRALRDRTAAVYADP